ncbi:hypothetical protein DBV05_g10094 [Lasiodiplodia theobromae]|uniref:Uncharacterized protein n=1 Tax=Lasiodiplodia theobromae TaxID=45133 RepID=A0A5N5D1E5_9PEZI|nr:hypothetical protein DBV05_g10094 [Lasiodiplodia theobromae]
MSGNSNMNMKRKFEDDIDNLSPSLKRMRMMEEEDDANEVDHVQHGRQSLVCLPGEMKNRIYNADSNKKRRFEDALHDLSPSLKRSKVMAEDEDTEMDHVHVEQNHQSSNFLTRIPGEIRNRIYDAFLAEILPQSEFVEPNILMTRCTSSDDDDTLTAHEALRREKARRQQEPYLSAIRTSALRCVPGVRKEFMSRLWHAVTLRFSASKPQSPIQACDFSFLRSVHPGIILYQVELEEIGLSHNDRLKMVNVFLPFIRALEEMKFKGTVRLLGRQDDVELAWCCIDRMQKYWRLGNSLMEVRNNMDGVWRMMSDIHRNTIVKESLETTFDMAVDMSPSRRIPGVSSDSGFIYRTAEPTDPFDGEPWCWQVVVGQAAPTFSTSPYANGRHFSRRVEKFRSIKRGYMKAKGLLAPVPGQEIEGEIEHGLDV